ncbi:hypothetical protein CMI47_03695 [Candidatus Pacearchaeota archaeon]|jgi:transcriptional regulator with XRE-family HTH domain|nr:hypothetical protein [Candidatus Pacearchaeota archaeon]|tara:strand:- start:362 stop:592 length:231 start_codon:yes stop_codon:yes gene_type:complete
MQLADYMSREGLTLEAFAQRIDKTAATVSRIARGINRPDWSTMLAIEEVTGGEVRPNDFAVAVEPPCDTEPTTEAA